MNFLSIVFATMLGNLFFVFITFCLKKINEGAKQRKAFIEKLEEVKSIQIKYFIGLLGIGKEVKDWIDMTESASNFHEVDLVRKQFEERYVKERK